MTEFLQVLKFLFNIQVKKVSLKESTFLGGFFVSIYYYNSVIMSKFKKEDYYAQEKESN